MYNSISSPARICERAGQNGAGKWQQGDAPCCFTLAAALSINKTKIFCIIVGVLNEDGSINNEASIARLAEISLNYAKEGRPSLLTLKWYNVIL